MQISRPLAAASAALLLLTGCSTMAPLEEPSPVSAPASCSSAQVRDAVRQAAVLLHFKIVSATEDSIRLSYPDNPAKRAKFHADFEVRYSEKGFEVRYLTSQGLSEQMGCFNQPGVRCAHRNVTRWMRNLSLTAERLLPAVCQNAAAQ